MKKPIKPIHRIDYKLHSLKYNDNLQTVLDATRGIDPKDVSFGYNCVKWVEPLETDEQYQLRLDEYTKSMKAYRVWAKENKDVLAAQKERKRQLLKQRKIDAQQKKVDEQLARLEELKAL